MKGKTLGIPNSIMTILVIDAIVIGLYTIGTLNTSKKLVGAKIIGTTALVGASMIA
jgi:hypothetical protein|tara:strand:+ start:9067 stop:9234 length:168 start_codon:yes stop_codon:yes gene_type:complete